MAKPYPHTYINELSFITNRIFQDYGKETADSHTSIIELIEEFSQTSAIQIHAEVLKTSLKHLDSGWASMLQFELKAEPSELSDIPFSDQKIAFISRETLHYGSPYDYLNVMLEPFWMKVFRKTASKMWYGGLVGVHGDKCREYIRDWETNGINKYRDSLIFLLAYTSMCREDMANVDQWVIDNYNKSISTRLISSNLIFKAS